MWLILIICIIILDLLGNRCENPNVENNARKTYTMYNAQGHKFKININK